MVEEDSNHRVPQQGKDGDEAPFDAGRDGRANQTISEAEANFRRALEALGHRDTYNKHGGAVLASAESPGARARRTDRRVFLKRLGWLIGGSFLGGEILWHVLDGEKWVPTVSDLGAEPATPAVDEAAWRFLKVQADAAISRRDLVGLNDLATSADEPFFKQVINAMSHHLRGQVGEALDIIESFEDHGLLAALPDVIKFDVLRVATRIYSIAGHSDRSLQIYTMLKQTGRYRQLSDVERIQMWRDEMNHCMQTCDGAPSYYEPGGYMLRHFDGVLSACLKYVGRTLDEARSFHPVVGPAVICMKEHRDWIAARRVDPVAANRALARQREAIESICERDRFLGPNRLSPLASQHIRAGNWQTAAEILAQQGQLWGKFDTQPEMNNALEFAIHCTLEGIVSAFGLADYGTAEAKWQAARKVLTATRSKRFQSVIVDLLLEIAEPAGITRDRRAALELDRRLLGPPFGSDYYFFGRD